MAQVGLTFPKYQLYIENVVATSQDNVYNQVSL